MHTDALFLFDIDGTLMRGGNQVHRDAFAHAFHQVYGLGISLAGVDAGGRTDTWLLKEPLRRHNVPEEQIEAGRLHAFKAMNEYVEQHLGDLRDYVLPGVRELLTTLHDDGRWLGLLTGNLSRIAWLKLRAADLDHYFDTGGFGEEAEIRSHLVPAAVQSASLAAGVALTCDRAVVIGDTPLDVEAGKVHSTRTVGVATGYFSEEQLRDAHADVVLPSFADVLAATELLVVLGNATS